MTTQEIYLVLDTIVERGQSEKEVQLNLYDFGMTLGQENVNISSASVHEHLEKKTFMEAIKSFIQGYVNGVFGLLTKCAEKHGSNVNDLVGMLAG